jgi:drug/metabolite transporter (DMT)-like permease
MTEHRLFPYFLILAAGAIWGLVFSLTLIATAQGAHPLGLSAWQVVLTAAFFGVVCLVSKITLFNFKNLRHYVVLALIGITVPNLLYYNAAPHLSAGILSITVSTVPLFTYAMMLMLRFESVVARRLSGIGVGMIAILLLVVPDQGLSSNDASFWILLVLLCAILYAFENVYISKGIARHTDVRELLFSSNLVAAVIQFPLAIYLGVDESWTWLASDAGLAIAGIAIGSSLAYAVTISGVIWGIMIFSEQHSIWVWLSVIVMLLGLMLVNPDDEAEVTDVGKSANVEKSI